MMLAQGSGRIIHVASRNALAGAAGSAAYGATKAAVMRLTESLSAEVKERGINVNCVIPGTLDTPPNRESMPKADFSRWVKPESLAEVILFLASDQARDIHGAAVPVFGLT
jgi:NAD(P)-dependent dehydrogenase (short-subunit alcohol dehydrogenase family)